MTISVNTYLSPATALPQAGLPQGSPLSLILFLFFNTNLVQNVINSHQGVVVFVDDYTVWVTGRSEDKNTTKLQQKVIPRAEEWERSSGATFQPKKTAFIHFLRKPRLLPNNTLSIKGAHIPPTDWVKILGVVMDQELCFKLHAARAAKRGLCVAMALKCLKGLRPSVARQLFTTTVAPTVDYTSSIWSSLVTLKTMKMLELI